MMNKIEKSLWPASCSRQEPVRFQVGMAWELSPGKAHMNNEANQNEKVREKSQMWASRSHLWLFSRNSSWEFIISRAARREQISSEVLIHTLDELGIVSRINNTEALCSRLSHVSQLTWPDKVFTLGMLHPWALGDKALNLNVCEN